MNELNNMIHELTNTLGQEYDDPTFYLYICKKLHQYELLLQENSQNINNFLQHTNELMGKPTFKRFFNLISRINKQCIDILAKAYKGDVLSATSQLTSLLSVQKYTDYKLVDMYANYLQFKRIKDYKLYRCIDFENGKRPDSCNHIPFHLRHLASKQRFNQLGVPCLYLCTSLDCCKLEIGVDVQDGYTRWYGIFEPIRHLFFADFSIPTKEDLDNMTDYDKFSFLITYPLRLLCMTKTKVENVTFQEEYLFSQFFMHILFFNEHENFPNFDGICYSSMKDKSCLNFVIPAKYDGIAPPIEGLSQFVLSLVKEISVNKL